MLYQAEPRPDEEGFHRATIAKKNRQPPAEGFTSQFYTTSENNRPIVILSEARICATLQRNAEVLRPRQKRVPQDDTALGQFDLLRQISPVRPNAHFHLKRHGQPMHFFHMLPHERLHNFHFILGNFEHQFVVHLQRHS